MGLFELSTEEITEGSILRAILLLAVPVFAQNMVLVGQQIIDLFWVGQYSGVAVAAIGLATPLVLVLMQVAIISSSSGTHVLVSQRVGADDTEGARTAAFTGLASASVLSVAVGAVAFVNADVLVGLVGSVYPESGAGSVPGLAATYLQVMAVGLVFAGLGDVVESTFMAWGDSRAALYINVSSVLFNVALDPVLIFGLGPVPELGIGGAALATVAGYAGGFLIGVAMVLRGRCGGVLSLSAATFEKSEFRELFDIGLPQTVQGLNSSGGAMLMVVVAFAAAGPAGLAAYTVGSRIGSLASRTAQALNHSTRTIVGQNVGAGFPERAVATSRTGVGVSVPVLFAFGAFQWVFAKPIVGVVSPELSAEATGLAVVFLRILAVAYPVSGALAIVKASFDAVRRTRTTMVASVVETWVIQLPVSVVGGIVLGYGAVGVFWGRALSIIGIAIGLGAYFVYTKNDGMFRRATERVGKSTAD